MKRKLLLIFAIAIIIAVCVVYYCQMSSNSRSTRDFLGITNGLHVIAEEYNKNSFMNKCQGIVLFNDYCTEEGEALSSWRAHIVQAKGGNDDDDSKSLDFLKNFNTNLPWNAPENIVAAKNQPIYIFYPHYMQNDEHKTCLLLIKETRDILIEHISNSNLESIANVPLVIAVNTCDAVPWTKPQDVSWEDIASGKVRSFHDTHLRYMSVNGVVDSCSIPKNLAEWRKLFNVKADGTKGQ